MVIYPIRDDAITKAELMAISDGYKRVAGYDRESSCTASRTLAAG